MLWSSQTAQRSPRECSFPLLCTDLEEKVQEQENWSHWATPFHCKSSGKECKSRQGRAIPSCSLQPTTPWAGWPQDREQASWLLAQHPPSLTYPLHCMGSRNQRGGDASICQCPAGAVPPGVEKWKTEFYPEVSAFDWHFSIFIEIYQRYSSTQKAKQFSSELKIEVFHLERLTDTILMFWSKINFELSCNKTLFGPDLF